MSFIAMQSTPLTVAKSVGVISLIEYMGPTIARALQNLVGGYAVLLARAIVLYLEFAAYNQGLISIPSNLLVSA